MANALAGQERRSQATEAALAVARRHGIIVDRPRILKDSNHTVIHLAPAPLVAKVGTTPARPALGRELAVARYLERRDAPIAPPADLLPAGPHLEMGLELTFWQYCPGRRDEPTQMVAAAALRGLHDSLVGYPDPLPPFDDLADLERLLDDPANLRALPPSDRAFLCREYERLRSQLAAFRYRARPLHGEPHGDNLLLTSAGPRWIDFESACLGPQEWDLTMLSDGVIDAFFEHVDHDLLRVLRRLRSLVVAVWCWLEPDRAPELREAAEYHLAALQGRA